MSEFNMPGFAELDRAMQELPAKIEANILRGALRAGQKVILDKARSNINDRSGDLSKSLRIRTSKRGGKVSAVLIAGDKKAYYPHMVEKGTAQHFIKPKAAKSLFFAGLFGEVVDHPGAAPKPFMRPALDSEQTKAAGAVREYIATRLPKEIKKARR